MFKFKSLSAVLMMSVLLPATPASAWVLEAMKVGSTIVNVAEGVAAGKASRAAAEARQREFKALMQRIESIEKELGVILQQLDDIQIALDALPRDTADLTQLNKIRRDISKVWFSADALAKLERYSEANYIALHRNTIADNLPDLLAHAEYLQGKIAEGDHLSVAHLALAQEAVKLSYLALAIHSQNDADSRSTILSSWNLVQNGGCDQDVSRDELSTRLIDQGFDPSEFSISDAPASACQNVSPSFFFTDLVDFLEISDVFWEDTLQKGHALYSGLESVRVSGETRFGYEISRKGSIHHRNRQAWLIATYGQDAPAEYPQRTPVCHVQFLTDENLVVHASAFNRQFNPGLSFEVPLVHGAIVLSGVGQIIAAPRQIVSLTEERDRLANIYYSDTQYEYLFREAEIGKPLYRVEPKGELTVRYHPILLGSEIADLDRDSEWLIDNAEIAPVIAALREPHTLCPEGADVSNGQTDIRDLIYGEAPEVSQWNDTLDIRQLQTTHPAAQSAMPAFETVLFDPQIPNELLVLLNPAILLEKPNPAKLGAELVNQITAFQALYGANLTRVDTRRSLDRLVDLMEE